MSELHQAMMEYSAAKKQGNQVILAAAKKRLDKANEDHYAQTIEIDGKIYTRRQFEEEFEFTGQKFIDKDKKTFACPVCGKHLTARGTGWSDQYCKTKFKSFCETNSPYVCKSCLSEERKAEILADNPNADFDSEKAWVDREQEEGPQPGPLEGMLTSVAKYSHDPEMMAGVHKVLEVAAEIKH